MYKSTSRVYVTTCTVHVVSLGTGILSSVMRCRDIHLESYISLYAAPAMELLPYGTANVSNAVRRCVRRFLSVLATQVRIHNLYLPDVSFRYNQH